jgi:hypothetical protein
VRHLLPTTISLNLSPPRRRGVRYPVGPGRSPEPSSRGRSLKPSARGLLALAAALALSLLAAVPASASEVTKIYEDCGNSTVPTGYSQQAYNQAMKQMPPELAEYDNCPDLIQKAQLARATSPQGAASHGAAASSSAPPTPTEQHTLESIPHTAAPPERVDGEVIHPGVVHVNLASAFNKLPAPLLALLAFLLACALSAIAWGVRQRVRRRGAQVGGDSIADE